MRQKTWKNTKTLAYRYSSESTLQELSNEYQHDRVLMVFTKSRSIGRVNRYMPVPVYLLFSVYVTEQWIWSLSLLGFMWIQVGSGFCPSALWRLLVRRTPVLVLIQWYAGNQVTLHVHYCILSDLGPVTLTNQLLIHLLQYLSITF